MTSSQPAPKNSLKRADASLSSPKIRGAFGCGGNRGSAGGRVNAEIEEITRAAGYRGGFTVHYGLSTPSEGVYQMDRIPIFGGNSHTMLRFKMRLSMAPLVSSLEHFKTRLNKNGHTSLAAMIPIP